jgi:hypothetical protein
VVAIHSAVKLVELTFTGEITEGVLGIVNTVTELELVGFAP